MLGMRMLMSMVVVMVMIKTYQQNPNMRRKMRNWEMGGCWD